MQRRIEQMLRCLDVSLGTVWRVREDLWREAFRRMGQPYDEHSARRWHPAVSLREYPPASLHEFVPMLHGTSSDAGPVVVRGLTRECGELHPTSFGNIVSPAQIGLHEITSRDSAAPRDRLTGHWFDFKRVAHNSHKLKLDAGELASLRAWATRRRIL